MLKAFDSPLDELREFAHRPEALQDKLVSVIGSRRPKGTEEVRTLRAKLLETLLDLKVPVTTASPTLTRAFKRCGLRARGPGGGRKQKPISATSAIQDIEKIYGDAAGSKRRKLARVLANLPGSSRPQIELVTFRPLASVDIQPQTGTPRGSGTAPANDATQSRRRAAKRSQSTIIVDQGLSEKAEDLAEEQILRPLYGDQLFRAGHRKREGISLPDGMVPGADFYAIDPTNAAGDPVAFIEIKSVTGNSFFEVAFTRAEYLRAKRCAELGVPYRLLLFNVKSESFHEARNFAVNFAALRLSEVTQFVIRINTLE